MKLLNTLSRSIEVVKPQNPPRVTVYTCGPTVYDYPHIGNWYTFIRYDLLIRALKAGGFQPTWVMNITDVGHLVSDADEGEDKLQKGARRENKTAWEVAAHYEDYFRHGLVRLNMLSPDYLPKATDHIQEQIGLIKELERKGYTYLIDDGVYFDTARFTSYADFARLDLDDLQAGARVEQNPQKRHPADFALWKLTPPGVMRDMEWESPWGRGFPGWHLECSAMAMKYLGETIDIHAGGIDHIPIHHTNEIAQSEAATGKRFANYWLHANHISVNGEKISKSLGNGILLEDIEAKGISLEAFRLHVLESHYRSQSKFSWESLQAAASRLASYQQMADLRWQPVNLDASTEDNNITLLSETAPARILDALADDLNTPAILAILSEVASNVADGISTPKVLDGFLRLIDSVLGTRFLESSDITRQQKEIVLKRQLARDAQDWTHADALRNELATQGIGIRDTANGQIWYRL